MRRKEDSGYRLTSSSYQLSPQQLEEIHRKYGRPGEISPGQPATKKRNRLDSTLAALDRKDTTTPFNSPAGKSPT